MNEKFRKLFELFDTVTMDIIVDIAIDNSWGRTWTPKIKQRFLYMQDKGEKMLQESFGAQPYDTKINKILNDMDDLWREAEQKGLL